MYILLYLIWIINKDLLYSTWYSAQCFVAAWMEESLGELDTCICMAESLCCSSQTTTILVIGYVAVVQSLSHVRLFVTPWTAACQASLSFTISQNLLKPMSIESMMPPSHLVLCHHFVLLPSIFPSIKVFSNEAVLCFRWPRYWSFSFSISPSSEYSGLISFRVDWLDLFAVQGTLKSLFQHHRSKASILQCLVFIIL